jgi:hypothetical protein
VSGQGSARMEGISRIAVEYVRQMLARDENGPRLEGALAKVDVPPVRVSLDLMTDQDAAREIAAAIYKVLSKVGGA